MSPLTIALAAILVLLGLTLAAIGLALFTPVVLVVDSTRAQLRVRWIFGLEYERPLPGGTGPKRLSFAGKAIPLRPRRTKPKRPKSAPQTEHPAPKGTRSARRGRFFYRCLREAGIRRVVFRQIAQLTKGIFRAADLARWEAKVSLPDPATTGILAGFAQCGWGRRLGMEANFVGENSVFAEIRFRPHRIVRPVLSFLIGLPYRAIIKQWRASLAEAPAR